VLVISSLSLQYVHCAVASTSAGVDVDPTGDVVALAFVPQGSTPSPSDFKTGSWVQDTTTVPTTHFARALVGPVGGVITLSPGLVDIYVRVSDNPETPVLKSGPMRII
jgi:hypothetical protein